MPSRNCRPSLCSLASLLVFLLLTSAVAASEGDGVYTLVKDGKTHRVSAVTRDGIDFLSVDDLATALGGEVAPGASATRARVDFGPASQVDIRAGRDAATVNGRKLQFSRPVVDFLDRLYVPPDFVTTVFAAALERAVKWTDRAAERVEPVAEAQDAIRAEIQVRSLSDYTRVSIRCPGSSVLPYTINAPAGSIVLRVQADNIVFDGGAIEVGDGALERIGFERRAGRATFTLELGPEYRDHQTAVQRDPFRIAVNIHRARPYDGPPIPAQRIAAAPAAAAATAEPAPAARPTVEDLLRGATASDAVAAGAPTGRAPAVARSGVPRRPLRTVVIDAGHGGSESGARGPTGLLEKDLTLDLAQRLGRVLERNLGLNVVYTRQSDTYLALEDRTGIANNEKADLFLSIHANASLRRNAWGAETYFLSSSKTGDSWRTHLAQETGAIDPSHGVQGTDLELILWSLAQNQYLRESEALAEAIQAELNSSLGIRDRGVKQAPFKVLVGATMPAVLVEVGFITNPEEEQRLADDEYKDKLVKSLYRSIRRFRAQGAEVKMGALGVVGR